MYIRMVLWKYREGGFDSNNRQVEHMKEFDVVVKSNGQGFNTMTFGAIWSLFNECHDICKNGEHARIEIQFLKSLGGPLL